MYSPETQKLLQEYEQLEQLARELPGLQEHLGMIDDLGAVLDQIRDLSEQLERLQAFEPEDQEPLPGWTVRGL